MNGLWKLTWVQMKLFSREAIAAFFTLVFPLMMLFIFGGLNGNEPRDFLNGFGMVDISVPSYTAMIIATSGLLSLTIALASEREKGVLRRLKATPLRPPTILTAYVIVMFLMTLLGMALLIVAAKLVFNLRFAGSPFAIIFAFAISCVSFFALGFVLAGIMPTARTAQVVGMALFYPMIFLSGAAIPLEAFPPVVRQYAQILPLTHVVNLLRGLWLGDGLGKHLVELGILAVIFVVGVIVSAKTFRWE